MKRLACLLLLIFTVTAAFAVRQTDTIAIATDLVKPSPVKVTVALPASYLNLSDTARYPVVYLLNGYSGNHTDYAFHNSLDSLATAYGVIFVCPDGRDSWYWNSPVDKSMQMESFITETLVPEIDRLYRTEADASHRAIAGLSMGGHGALWLAIRHPDIWSRTGSMSGGVDITPHRFHKRWKMSRRLGPYASDPAVWKAHSVMSLADSIEPGKTDIIITCGDSDIFIEENNALSRALADRGISHVFRTSEGNHSWNYWKQTLPSVLDFLTRGWK